ncbi:hypothetical protein [Rhodobacteraceae bacterium DSL-40]|uniref:hypothetical protein n=1 Tax=Amaricoccus sp. B4 TaxID=3368557 RepID=UPI0013A697F6
MAEFKDPDRLLGPGRFRANRIRSASMTDACDQFVNDISRRPGVIPHPDIQSQAEKASELLEYHRMPSDYIKQAMRALDCEIRVYELHADPGALPGNWFAESFRPHPFIGEKHPCEQCHVISKRVFTASSDLDGLLCR